MVRDGFLNNTWHSLVEYSLKNVKIVLVAVGIVAGCCAGGAYSYMQRVADNNRAVIGLIDVFDELANVKDVQGWTDFQAATKAGVREFGHTNSDTYFKLVEAHALIQLGRIDQARDSIADVYHALKKSDPLYYMVATTYARMLLDVENSDEQSRGRLLLEQLASDNANTQHDYANYYLVQSYKNEGNVQAAQAIINEYNAMGREAALDESCRSPWILALQRG
jgi:hypothetical protein